MKVFGILVKLDLADALGQVLALFDHSTVQELALQLLCHVEDLLECWRNLLLQILVFGYGNHRNRILLLKTDSSSHLGK